VIGNNDYDDSEKLLPSMKILVVGVEALADILKTDYVFAESFQRYSLLFCR
jgi:hypothetical protein